MSAKSEPQNPITHLIDLSGVKSLLKIEDRREIVEQALILLDGNYVHLPFKAARHAVNPVQRLRVLRRRMEMQTEETMPPELEFHSTLSEIFLSLRDLHTNYLLPRPYAGKVAYLPFLIEKCVDSGEEKYLVTKVADGYSPPGFEPGVEVTHWNGTLIAKSVELNGARFAGSNAAALRSRGINSLTFRPLTIHLPPLEEWVLLGYLDAEGSPQELRATWQVMQNEPSGVDAESINRTAMFQGIDLEADEINRAVASVFSGPRRGHTDTLNGAQDRIDNEYLPTTLPQNFRAQEVCDSQGDKFGYVRIFSFGTTSPRRFCNEFINLINRLPQNGLIIDVRGNGGGHIHAAELLLQLLTPGLIEPETMQFINTPLNLEICRASNELASWVPSLEEAVEVGATYSASFPLTDTIEANSIGQKYYSPVILITDACSYSATDMFAAGFQDHKIGLILGTDSNTGAGGANVWTHALLCNWLGESLNSPYRPLPHGAGMRVSLRRSLRVRDNQGALIEDLGVTPDKLHSLTRKDLLEQNADLIEKACNLLSQQPRYQIRIIRIEAAGGVTNIDYLAENVDRLDVYLDGRPQASLDVSDGEGRLRLQSTSAFSQIRIDGLSAGRLVVSRIETLRTVR
ncbi:S41 family peptidase [Streptomyces sp. NPDC090112]|uniref:S41 family peptidase n=1 Tax=Streptomyces sp. NPDC090112 TaxID=3365949 RepID=UPI003803E100